MLQGLGSTWFNYTTNSGSGHLSNILAFSYHSNFAWVLQVGPTYESVHPNWSLAHDFKGYISTVWLGVLIGYTETVVEHPVIYESPNHG